MKFLHTEYYKNQKINKNIEQIWEDIDTATGEILPNDDLERKNKYSNINLILPPLKTSNGIIKGLIASNAVDYLHTFVNNLDNNYITIANAMWGNIPYSEKANMYFTCYKNKVREIWIKNKYPNKANKILIPYQDADLSNENILFPIEVNKKYDVLMIARLEELKNIDIFLKSLIYIKKVYKKQLNALLVTGEKYTQEIYNNSVYKKLIEIATSKEELQSYLNIAGYVPYQNLFYIYSQAKITALTSLFEGKNRSIQESLLCNTPVICFSSYNQYIRGESPILPHNCAYYVDDFSPEAFGEKLYQLLYKSKINYNTRNIAMKHYGRTHTVNKILKSIPYYVENIPDLLNNNVLENNFINSAIYNQYQTSYYNFLYKRNPTLTDSINERNNYVLHKYS